MPFYCVSWVKHLLGLRNCIAMTPYQLYKELVKRGGTVGKKGGLGKKRTKGPKGKGSAVSRKDNNTTRIKKQDTTKKKSKDSVIKKTTKTAKKVIAAVKKKLTRKKTKKGKKK